MSQFQPHQGPPGVFQQPVDGSAGGSAAPQRLRRRVHVSTAATLALAIPWFLVSVAVVASVAGMFAPDSNTVILAAVGVFVLSGGLAFYGPTEDVLAKVMFRFRRPTMHEQRRLDQVWGNVAQAAGVDERRYRLWVQDSQEPNAYATSGHVVAVTRAALDLPPNHLAAVLAHELGHHLGGHAWARLLTYWYSIPGRLVVRIWYWINYVIFAVLTGFSAGAAGVAVGGRAGVNLTGCLFGFAIRMFGLLWMLMIAWVLYSIHPAALLLLAIPVVLAWFGRHGEKFADRIAADLGYGQAMIEVLYGWLNSGHDHARSQRGWRANLFATHPTCASRIQALEKYLYGRTSGRAA